MAKRTPDQILNDIEKPAALARINAVTDSRLAEINAAYPRNEPVGWVMAFVEAERVLSGSSLPTPFTDGAAVTSGLTREQIAEDASTEHLAYWSAAGEASGRRVKAARAIREATTIEEVEAAEREFLS